MKSKDSAPKEKWQKPTLIVLDRVRPEEHVLGACKTVGVPACQPGAFVFKEGSS